MIIIDRDIIRSTYYIITYNYSGWTYRSDLVSSYYIGYDSRIISSYYEIYTNYRTKFYSL